MNRPALDLANMKKTRVRISLLFLHTIGRVALLFKIETHMGWPTCMANILANSIECLNYGRNFGIHNLN